MTKSAALFVISLLFCLSKDQRKEIKGGIRSRHTKTIEKGELWVRVGNVEMWALRDYLRDPKKATKAAVRVAEILTDGREAAAWIQKSKDSWWPGLDPHVNITRLSRIAGWHSNPEDAAEVFIDWAERYKVSIQSAFTYDYYPYAFLTVKPYMPDLIGRSLFKYNQDGIVEPLRQADVVFATQYAAAVHHNFARGGVEALWQDAGLGSPMRRLTTVQAPLSTWPYRPDRNWSESFRILVDNCTAAVEQSSASVFVASCGCYGLPLTDEIHRRFGITCIYHGHSSNLYFGILTNDFFKMKIYKRTANGWYWIGGNLAERYPDMKVIEDGRYV